MAYFSCIVTAGGAGTRFDKKHKKQFFEINGRPILHVAIDIFYSVEEIKEIIVTLPNDELERASTELYRAFGNKVRCVSGSVTRQESVYNALQACNKDTEYVIIHDGVRPFLKESDLSAMMSMVVEGSGVIAASKAKNTIKIIDGFLISRTIQRENLIEVFTPQIFKMSKIKECHERAKTVDVSFTDDASIFEYFGEPVRWFETDSSRLKITTKDDLDYAIYLYNKEVLCLE